jgi:hypothetical protein
MRRSFVAVALAVVAIGVSAVQATAQTAPPAQQPAAAPAQAPAADPLLFTTDNLLLVISVKPAGVADFEAGFIELQKALAASPKPELVAHGKSMTLNKVEAPFPADQPHIYVLAINGASKDLSYNLGLILFYSGKPQGATYSGIMPTQEAALAIYNKLQGNIVGINPWPLTKIGG